MGVDGENQVYLDLTHKDPDYLTKKLGGILEIYEKFVGVDPRFDAHEDLPRRALLAWAACGPATPRALQRPPPPRPSTRAARPPPDLAEVGQGMQLGAPNNMHDQHPGLYAFGEVNFAYHGANRLGANALLSCIFDGLFCGVSVANYVREARPPRPPRTAASRRPSTAAVAAGSRRPRWLLGRFRPAPAPPSATNPYIIGKELGDEMTAACTVVRTSSAPHQCAGKLAELASGSRGTLADGAAWSNQSLSYARAVGDMLVLAEAIAKARRCARKAAAPTTAPTSPTATTPSS
jgi:succinate dehydrogenase / fumarate reductase flavoprotein subunit